MYGFSFFLSFSVTRSFFPYIQKPNEWRNVSEKIVPNMHIYCSLHGLFSADYSKKSKLKKKSEKHSANIFTLTFKYIYNSKTTFLCWCFQIRPNSHHFESIGAHVKTSDKLEKTRQQTHSMVYLCKRELLAPIFKSTATCMYTTCNNINIWIMT